MPAKKNKINPDTLEGEALFKETCRRIRAARSLWKSHRNKACRGERLKALHLYDRLDPKDKQRVPEELRTWLKYRSEKYFGTDRAGNGAKSKK
jgi:hypothetical protein